MLEVNYHKTKLKDFVGQFPNEILVIEPNEKRIFLWPDSYEKELKKYNIEYLLNYVITSIKASEYADYWIVRVEEDGVEYCDWRKICGDLCELQCKKKPRTLTLTAVAGEYRDYKYCPYCGKKIRWVDK